MWHLLRRKSGGSLSAGGAIGNPGVTAVACCYQHCEDERRHRTQRNKIYSFEYHSHKRSGKSRHNSFHFSIAYIINVEVEFPRC